MPSTSRRSRRTARLWRGHWPFLTVVAAAVAIRVVVLLGYPPIMWYGDSYSYVAAAVQGTPTPARLDGYPLLLAALAPVHDLTVLAALQAAMGVAMGVAIYAVLRRRGLIWWAATLAALPVLFDVFEIQLEHLVMSDVEFTFLVTVAVVALCWYDEPPLWLVVVVGLLIGYATTVRSVGEPLLVVVAVGMLLRRIGWRAAAAMFVAGLLPVVAYVFWFHQSQGRYALTESTGPFLYSRVSSFANCAVIRPPADLRVLCDPRPPADRPNSQKYLWSTNTPLWTLAHGDQFTPRVNRLTRRFAERAILAQPGAYLSVVASDTLRSFAWTRTESDLTGSGVAYHFEPSVTPVWRNRGESWVLSESRYHSALRSYAGPGLGQPTVVQPYAGFLIDYQRYVYLRGPFLAGLALLGLAGILARWRRRGGVVLLPWAVAALLLVLPPMMAGFSYRYVLAAVPVSCLAAGLAVTRDRDRAGAGRAVCRHLDAAPAELGGPS